MPARLEMDDFKSDSSGSGEQPTVNRGGVVFAGDVEAGPRRGRVPRKDSMESMSIRAVSRRRSVDPSLALPPHFRTMSFDVQQSMSDPPSKKIQAEKADIEFTDIDHHIISSDELFRRFITSPTYGLSDEEATKRLKEIGPNTPTAPPSRWFRKTITYLFGGFGAILFIAGILVFIAWKPLGQPAAPANLALAIVLILVWIIQALFSFWQDFSSSRVMASINTMLPDQCSVLRDGTRQTIEGTAIVPGDIIYISMGNKLPADVRFIEVSSDARFDRSILTGEAAPLLASIKSTDKNYLETACIGMAGTHCASGSTIGVVVNTGDRTVFGQIAKLTSTPKAGLTPLQKEILYFVGIIVALMVTMIIVVVVVWASWLRKDHPDWITVAGLIVDCVSVAVAFIPEGLPIAVTASLTITANIMRRNKVLCKSLKTVETLGSVDIICSDKTGTLTRVICNADSSRGRVDADGLEQNQMTVTDYFHGGDVQTANKAPGLLDTHNTIRHFAHMCAVCNAGEFDAATMKLPIADRVVNGDATDKAIIRFAEAIVPVSESRNVWQTIFRIAFNSKNKFMIHIIQQPSAPQESPILTIKGAPDILLPRCTSQIQSNGTFQELTADARQKIEDLKDSWSAQGKRVILVAQKQISSTPYSHTEQPREYEEDIMERARSGLVLVGLVAIVDPPREEIPEVIRTLRGAGIRVFMVTGDFKLTAQAIAIECGIITQEIRRIDDASALQSDLGDEKGAMVVEGEVGVRSIVISGSDLEQLGDSHWDKLCAYDEIVFARTTPDHKLRIVKQLQQRDHTVGMTGDGVNDAPSLKAADVGIAMGSGSDIAIEAADMVLLDSFSAIVEAVHYGRNVYDNLKKTICYLLPAGSFSEFWPVLTNVCFGLPQVLSSFLMIIICCFTDCAAATAIAYEKPEADTLLRPPRSAKKDRLVDWKLIFQAYGIIGVIETLCSFSMAYWYAQRKGLSFGDLWFKFGETPGTMDADTMANILNEASSIYFVNLVVMQWFNLLATRTRRLSLIQHPPWRNVYLAPAIVFAFVIAIFFLYVPKFHGVLETSTIPVEYWFLPMGFGVGILLIDEMRKWLVRKYPHGALAKMAW